MLRVGGSKLGLSLSSFFVEVTALSLSLVTDTTQNEGDLGRTKVKMWRPRRMERREQRQRAGAAKEGGSSETWI